MELIKQDPQAGDLKDLLKNRLTKGDYTIGGAAGREEDSSQETTHVKYYVGSELKFGIDYLAFTIFGSKLEGLQLYEQLFGSLLGGLKEEGQTKFYGSRLINGGGFEFLADPKIPKGGEHFRFILPGAICDQIEITDLRKLLDACLKRSLRLNCTRIDLKIDNCPFKPLEAFQTLNSGMFRGRSGRETLKFFDQPHEKNELGDIGTTGLNFGSRNSERFMRIYDAHGFTRLELECKGATALFYFLALMHMENFCDQIMGYVIDFVDLDADFWREFTMGYKRIIRPAVKRPDPELEALERYAFTQCAPAIGLLTAIKGRDWLDEFIDQGIRRAYRDPKYKLIIHAHLAGRQ
jgi:DNA relaxase NicK